MRMVWTILITAALLGASFARAETLGEAAEREAEKRKAKPTPSKVITEADLERAGSRGNYSSSPDTPVSAPAAPATGAAAPVTALGPDGKPVPKKTEEELRADAQKAWHEKQDSANKELKDAQENLTHIETQAQSPAAYSNPTLASDLEAARKAVSAAQDKLNALEDERRRAGYH